MQQILILGGGAAGLAAALAAAQTAEGRAHITVLDKNAKVGKKLLATGNGRCNLDNRDITPERYFTRSPKALRRLLSAVDEAAPLAWFESLGLNPRADEAGRVYPYSNQAADVLALLEHHLSRLGVEVRTGCTVQNLSQSRGGYAVQIETETGRETLRADAVICAMGGDAGPQFGTDGFGTRFAAQCGGRMAPLYPCLTALQCAHPRKPLAGIRQGLRQPAGRCRWPGACPGNGRGAVHRVRAFGHLHHAAFGPAGPGARAEAACRGPRPLPCSE